MELLSLRINYHRHICKSILGYKEGMPNIADRGSKTSRELAERLLNELPYPPCSQPPSGQTAGARFSGLTKKFLNQAFEILGHLRPGEWIFSASQAKCGITAFDQYEHLGLLAQVLEDNKQLATALGGDCLVTPDIVIGRMPITDGEINRGATVVQEKDAIATQTPLRICNSPDPKPILHASVSCKWTIRSDRSQNTRTEALNLIRNRKGNTPHIVAVTAEPMPTRIASLAMGTGDIDCVYHMALPELMHALQESGRDDQEEILDTLVEGRRLRDIADLAFDLVI